MNKSRFRCRLGVLVPSLIVAALLTPAVASAAEWSLSSLPGIEKEIGGGGGGVAVSCISSSDCLALSNSYGAGAGLAYKWNGTGWERPSALAPRPSEEAGTVLRGISCTSVGECTAVGLTSSHIGSYKPLAERTTNGKEWSIQTTPGAGNFRAVSCASPTACTAVGEGNGGTLAEGWNGKEWTSETVPGGSAVALDVSCSSASNCVMVGYSGTGSLLDRWNGKEWLAETPASPPGGASGWLRGVSCSSSTACTAVGLEETSTGRLLVESWNGKEWSVQSAPSPGGSKASSNLSGVSCQSASECTAVGTTNNGEAVETTLAESWNGKEWSIDTTPNPETGRNGLTSVSCNSGMACVAVGEFKDQTALRLSAGTWTATAAIPAPKTSGSGVGCAASGSCIATANDPWAGFVYAWSGSAWGSPSRLSASSEATKSALNGVSCVSASECTAVGQYSNAAGETLTWAEHMSEANEWASQTTTSPAALSSLAAVSCPSSTACTAVGSAEKLSGASEPLAESWNGTAWSSQTVPVPSKGEKAHLVAVSCTSASECTAVGSYVASAVTKPLVERWNGKEWSVETVPAPEGSTELALHAVSCESATECTAVGGYNNGTARVALVEQWSSKSWAVKKTVKPTEATSTELFGASCVTTAACVGVGDYGNAKGEELTLVLHTSLWGKQTSPNPSTDSRLNAVSCKSSEACVAIGTDTTNETAFAEQYS
jgi:hypothetical protein